MWKIKKDFDCNEYKNETIETNKSIWHAFKFKQNYLAVTVPEHVGRLILEAATAINLKINSKQDNEGNSVTLDSQDKQNFCKLLLNFAEKHKLDVAYDLGAVQQELLAASIDIAILGNILKRLEAIESGVQYQALPTPKVVTQPILNLFEPKPAITRVIQAPGMSEGTSSIYNTAATSKLILRSTQYIAGRTDPDWHLREIKNAIAQGANLNVRTGGKHLLDHILEHIYLATTFSKERTLYFITLLELLLANGANPNNTYTFVTGYQATNFLRAITQPQNKEKALYASQTLCLLMHYGFGGQQEIIQNNQHISLLERTLIKEKILKVYNDARRAQLQNGVQAQSSSGLSFATIESDLHVHGFAATTDLNDIGREARAQRHKIDKATKIQARVRSFLARKHFAEENRDERCQARLQVLRENRRQRRINPG